MTPTPEFDTPILFLVFNRPDTTKRVFTEIRRARPKRLYLASDGARDRVPGEREKVDAVREWVLNKIDWDCDVKTLFRSENLGCKRAVSGAISWMFSMEERGIILEDDCLPDPSFFSFCEEMLERYENAEQVMSISGYNPLGAVAWSDDIIFSKYFFSWGWATWAKSWAAYDQEFSDYLKLQYSGKLSAVYPGPLERAIRSRRIGACLNGGVDSWAIPWNVTHHMRHSLSIVPASSLINNIGFSDTDATHTKANVWDVIFFGHASASRKNVSSAGYLDPKEDKRFTRKFLRREAVRSMLKIMAEKSKSMLPKMPSKSIGKL